MVARRHYLQFGFKVWVPEPRFPKNQGYILTSFPGYRGKKHPAYLRMAKLFGLDVTEGLNQIAEKAKTEQLGKRNRGGGDPDLFVFKGDGQEERFFVEVKYEDPARKYKDSLKPNQHLVFPLIEAILKTGVKLARVYPLTVEGSVSPTRER
jgi:hypothetical protein